MDRKDWTLLVIAQASESLQPVQLQKSLFLIGENLSKRDLAVGAYYKFRPYDYGPFSPQVYEDAEALEAEGLVAIRRPPVSRFKQYLATTSGRSRSIALESDLEPRVVHYLRSVVAFVSGLSFEQLVSAVYAAYPEMKVNSVFKDAT